MQDTAPNFKPLLSFGFRKKSPAQKPVNAVASIFVQQNGNDDDVDVEDTVVKTLSLQAVAVEKIVSLPSSPPGNASSKQAKVDALREAGNARADAGNMRQALTLFEEAISLAPTSSILFELKSQCHLSLEEYLEAVRAARRAVDLAPEWSEGALTLGRSLLSLGEVRAAVTVLSEVLGRDGCNEEIREELIYANNALMELRRREADFDLQLNGRAGLDERELEVARAKRHLLARGADVSSDCWLGGSEGSSWDREEGEEEEKEKEDNVRGIIKDDGEI
ncbi:stress-inducible protein [Nannochloropsis oceanica]